MEVLGFACSNLAEVQTLDRLEVSSLGFNYRSKTLIRPIPLLGNRHHSYHLGQFKYIFKERHHKSSGGQGHKMVPSSVHNGSPKKARLPGKERGTKRKQMETDKRDTLPTRPLISSFIINKHSPKDFKSPLPSCRL